MKKGIHVSIKKKYSPLQTFLESYRGMGCNASELICELAMAGLTTSVWKTRAQTVLSSSQQAWIKQTMGDRRKIHWIEEDRHTKFLRAQGMKV